MAVKTDVTRTRAVMTAYDFRLDLQTVRDRVDDAIRQVDNARNALLPDLDFSAEVNIPTDPNKDRGGVDFSTKDASFQTGLMFSVPLDRQIERYQLRQQQISLERSYRGYERARDDIAIEVRDAVREMERSLFTVELQAQSLTIARERLASIKAASARVDSRDSADAVTVLTNAQNELDRANRDLQLAILGYLLDSGQLRISRRGIILPLPGMDLSHGGGRDVDGSEQKEQQG